MRVTPWKRRDSPHRQDGESPEAVPNSSGTTASAGVLFASRMVVAALGWFGTLFIVRSLSPSDWGQFSFVFNVLALLFIVTNAVGPRVAIRGVIDQQDASTFVGSYVILRTVLGGIAYLIAVAFVYAAGYPSAVHRAMLIAGSIVVISSLSNAYVIVFQVRNRLRPVATSQVAGQAAQLVFTLVLASVGASLVEFVLPAVLCEIVILAWVLLQVSRLIKVRYRVQLSTWGSLLRSSIPIAIGQGLFLLYANVDGVLLSKLQTFQAVGLYGIATKFSNLVAMIPMAMSVAVMGTLVASWPDATDRFWSTLRSSFIALFLVAALICGQFIVFAGPIVRFLYGRTYGQAAGAARIVVVAACVSFFTVVLTTALTSQGRNVVYVLAGALGLVFNVGVNLVVIPRWSFRGAAWVTVATEILVVGVIVPVCLRGHMRVVIPWREMAITLMVGAPTAAVGWGLYQIAPWPVSALVSSLLFLVGVHVVKAPGPRGLRSLWEN